MKKTSILLAICLLTVKLASAQILPSFAFGIKGGLNLSQFSHTATFSADKRAGYLAGVYARVGALGFNFQPELYYTSKVVDITSGGAENKATFNSIDVPLLLGAKIGAFGVGGRFYTGPMFSMSVNKDQSITNDLGNVVHLNYKDQNIAWVGGVGLDLRKFSADLRYEYGLSKQTYSNNNDQTRVSLFNITLAYQLFSL